MVAGACGDDDGGEGSAAQRPHIGFLSASSSPAFVDALNDGLRDLGYVDGTTIELDLRPTDDEAELPAIAAALVEAEVDLIIAGGTRAVEAAKKATSTIPIVMTNSGDPVGTGLVASAGPTRQQRHRPHPDLAPAGAQAPRAAEGGVPRRRGRSPLLLNPAHPATKLSIDELRADAPGPGHRARRHRGRPTPPPCPRRWPWPSATAPARSIVLRDPFTVNAAKDIVAAANDAGLPAIYETDQLPRRGRAHALRPRLRRPVPALGPLRRPHPQGRRPGDARRSSSQPSSSW